jgi:oligopeptide transport system permease protein
MAVLGLIIVIVLILGAIFADFLAPYRFDKQSLSVANTAPQWVTTVFPSMIPVGQERGYVKVNNDYPLGADRLGRDLFSRILYGSRVSLMVALIGPIVAMSVGVTLGLLSGFLGGWVDNLIMRITDIVYAFPTLLFIILLMAFFRPSTGQLEVGTFAHTLNRFDAGTGGMFFIFIGIGVTSWTQMARLTRGQVLSIREQEYVVAARAMGVKSGGIMLRHVLPNILGPLIVAETLAIPAYISTEAFLSFIGLGVNPPTPSWGGMISDGAGQLASYPNQAIFPAIALFLTMFAFNFLGDGLRDALDPRMRGKG